MRCLGVILLCCLSSTPLLGRATSADPAYSSALQAADRFLHAWQTQDHEAGIMMLSDHARQHASPEQLQEFFAPVANAAFEIEHGVRRKAGGYAFPVVLFGAARSAHAYFSRIVIVQTGKDDWAGGPAAISQ